MPEVLLVHYDIRDNQRLACGYGWHGHGAYAFHLGQVPAANAGVPGVVFAVESARVHQVVQQGQPIAFIRADFRTVYATIEVRGFVNAPTGYSEVRRQRVLARGETMFYPAVFPHSAPGVPPEETLAVEAAAMCLLVSADKGFINQLKPEAIVPSVAHELHTSAVASYETAEAVARANEEPLLHFVKQELRRPLRASDWDLVWPDFEHVRDLLGPATADQWRGRIAGWLQEGRDNVERRRAWECEPVSA
jgi:hypothetical protein